jgi:hypothetical protein
MSPTSRVILFAAASPLLAAAGTAQVVWPPAFASVRGNAVMNGPFTVAPHLANTSTRWFVVLDASTVPFPVGTVIHRLSLRRDASYPQAYASATGQMVVRMGKAAAAPGALDDVRFWRMFDGPSKAVFNTTPQTPYALPGASAPTGSAPAPFSVVIPFQRPYTWTGGPLAIEISWTPAAGTSTFRLDAVALPRRAGTSRNVASGCTGSNGFEPTHFVLPETTSPGATLQTQLEGARTPVNSLELLAIHALGLPPASPLPLSAIGGVPGCNLRVDPLLTQAVVVGNPSRMFARALSATALPANQGLVGVVLQSQWLCFDTAFATPLPLTASDTQAITLGPVAVPAAPRSVRTWWRYGSALQGHEAGHMVTDDYGPVLLFN